MALQMAYTDATGTNHPSAYWAVGPVRFDARKAEGSINFLAFHDSQAAADKKSVGIKSYKIDTPTYMAFFAATVLDPDQSNPWKHAYTLAKSHKDVLKAGYVQQLDGTYEDDQGNPVSEEDAYESFFASAIDV